MSLFSIFSKPDTCTIDRMVRLLGWALCFSFPFLLFFLFGCAATPSTSSGLLLGKNAHNLPQGVPRKVAVVFSGESPIHAQSADQFSAGLVELGFQVVERQHADKVVGELRFQYSGMVSEKTMKKVGELLGVDGLFVGTVTGESSSLWIDTHLTVKLVDIETGQVVWSGTAHDPRLLTMSMDVRTSIVYTTEEALKLLKNDLYRE